MRTDAKIGFAIGGVLLAVLTVYAIVVPKHTAKKPGTVSLVTTPTGADTPTPPTLTGTSDLVSGTTTQPPTTPSHDASTGGSHSDSGTSTTPPRALPGTPGLPDAVTGGGGHDEMVVIKPDDKSTDLTKPATHPKADRTGPDHVKPAPFDVADTGTTSDRLYTIKSGQTLSSIAYEVYGNARFFVAIQRENRGLDPIHLKPGTKIKLPDIAPPTADATPVSVSDDSIIPPAGMDIAVPRTVRVSTPIVASNDGHTYTVKSGDSLYAIARKLLGSGRKADALYELNKDLIGPDKSRLKLGMVLKLPEAARTASAQ